jgi:hypothetical protein
LERSPERNIEGQHLSSGKGLTVRNAFLCAVLVTLLGGFAPIAAPAAVDESPSPTDSASTEPSAAASPTASANVTASPGPESPVDDTLASARAKEWLARLQRGQLDRAQMTSDLSAGLQDATVQALAKQIPLGTPQHIVLRTRKQLAGITTWVFRVSWPDQTLDYTFGIDNVTGKISALYLRPGAPA